MPTYDFICSKCQKVQEVFMGMTDVGKVPVFCSICSETSWQINSNGELSAVDPNKAILMSRYYGPGCYQPGIVKGRTVGSLMDSKSFRNKNSRPEDFFVEDLKKKQDLRSKIEQREKETGKTINLKFKDV